MARKKETIGDRVTALRDEKKLNRLELAAKALVSVGAIQLLEKGVTQNPSRMVIYRLAKALGVTPEYLRTGFEGEAATQ